MKNNASIFTAEVRAKLTAKDSDEDGCRKSLWTVVNWGTVRCHVAEEYCRPTGAENLIRMCYCNCVLTVTLYASRDALILRLPCRSLYPLWGTYLRRPLLPSYLCGSISLVLRFGCWVGVVEGSGICSRGHLNTYFFLVLFYEVWLSPLGTSASVWPIVPAPDDGWVWSSRATIWPIVPAWHDDGCGAVGPLFGLLYQPQIMMSVEQ
jgi:hypothetical protein